MRGQRRKLRMSVRSARLKVATDGRREEWPSTCFCLRPTPPSLAFLDETGSISRGRFFAVSLLLHPEPPRVLRSMQKYRDRTHDYGKFHLTDLTQGALNTYEGFVDTVLADSDFRFFCCVAARDPADPVARFADPWTAYLKLFERLLIGAIRPG